MDETARAASAAVTDHVIARPVALRLDSNIRAAISNPALLPSAQEAVRAERFVAGTNGRLIILLRDAHANLSAQKNLYKAAEFWAKETGIDLILSEAAWGEAGLGEARGTLPPQDLKRAADRLLWENLITGHEYLTLVSDLPVRIVGVEDPKLYRRNWEVFRRMILGRYKVNAALTRSAGAVDGMKRRDYPKELLAYEASLSDVDDWIKKYRAIRDLTARSGLPSDASAEEALGPFRMLEALEKNIDYSRLALEQERALGEARTRCGDCADRLADAFKKAGPSVAALQSAVGQLARACGRDTWESSSELGRYQHYLGAMEAIDPAALFDAVDGLEQNLYVQLAGSRNAQATRFIDRHTRLLESAYSLRLSPQETHRLNSELRRVRPVSWQAELNDRMIDQHRTDDILEYEPELTSRFISVRNFYRLAALRDHVFVRRSNEILTASKKNTAILIAGGYHTDNLTELFKKRGYSVAVFTPFVTSETDPATYERTVLASDPGPARAHPRADQPTFTAPTPNPTESTLLAPLVRTPAGAARLAQALPRLTGDVRTLVNRLLTLPQEAPPARTPSAARMAAATADDDGSNNRWPQAKLHLLILQKQNEPTRSRVDALRALAMGLVLHPGEPTGQYVQSLLALYAVETNPMFRTALLRAAAIVDPVDPGVLEILAAADAASDQDGVTLIYSALLERLNGSFIGDHTNYQTKDRIHLDAGKIRSIAAAYGPVLIRQLTADRSNLFQYARYFRSFWYYKADQRHYPLAEDPAMMRDLIPLLESFYTEGPDFAPDPSERSEAKQLNLILQGQPFPRGAGQINRITAEVNREMFPDRGASVDATTDDGAYASDEERHAETWRANGGPDRPHLSESDLAELADQLGSIGQSPSELIGDLFSTHRKHVLFWSHAYQGRSDFLRFLAVISADLESVIDDGGMTHLALPFTQEKGDLLGSYFEGHTDIYELARAIDPFYAKPGRTNAQMDPIIAVELAPHLDHIRSLFTRLKDLDIPITFYEPSGTEDQGEVRMDRRVNAIVKAAKSRNDSRIVVISTDDDGAKHDRQVESVNAQTDLAEMGASSLLVKLKEDGRIEPDQIAAVTEEDDVTLYLKYVHGVNNLRLYFSKYARHSAGLTLGPRNPISRLFHDGNKTYTEGFDAFIYRKDKDGEDPGDAADVPSPLTDSDINAPNTLVPVGARMAAGALDDSGANDPWPQARYHLHIVNKAAEPMPARIEALKALVIGLVLHPGESKTEYIRSLIALYKKEPSPQFKPALLYAAVFLDPVDEGVLSIYADANRRDDHETTELVISAISERFFLFFGGIFLHDIGAAHMNSDPQKIRSIAAEYGPSIVKKLAQGGIEAYKYLSILDNLWYYGDELIHYPLATDAHTMRVLIPCLEAIYENAKIDFFERRIAKQLKLTLENQPFAKDRERLNEIRDSAVKEMGSENPLNDSETDEHASEEDDPIDEDVTSWKESGDLGVPHLLESDLARLTEQAQIAGQSSAELIGDLFATHRKHIIFWSYNFYMPHDFLSFLKRVADDLESVADHDAMTHLAIPLSKKNGDLLRGYFAGDTNILDLAKGILPDLGVIWDDRSIDSMVVRTLEANLERIRRLFEHLDDLQVQIIFYEPSKPENQGEILMDERIKSIVDAEKFRSDSRIVVLGDIKNGSKSDRVVGSVRTHDNWFESASSGMTARLIKEEGVGPDKIASVIEEDDHTLRMNHTFGIHNLHRFFSSYPHRTLGLMLDPQNPIARLLHTHDRTYGETHDAIIFRKSTDDDGGDFGEDAGVPDPLSDSGVDAPNILAPVGARMAVDKDRLAENLEELYELDPEKARRIARQIREGSIKEVSGDPRVAAEIWSGDKKIFQVSPLGTAHYFDENGRWILTVDPFRNPIEQFKWSAENRFERGIFWDYERSRFVLEPVGDLAVDGERPGDVYDIYREEIIDAGDQTPRHPDDFDDSDRLDARQRRAVFFFHQPLDVTDAPWRIPGAAGSRYMGGGPRDGIAIGATLLNILAWMTWDSAKQMRYVGGISTEMIVSGLHEVAMPAEELKGSFEAGGIWWNPDPVERIFNPNGTTLAVRPGEILRAYYGKEDRRRMHYPGAFIKRGDIYSNSEDGTAIDIYGNDRSKDAFIAPVSGARMAQIPQAYWDDIQRGYDEGQITQVGLPQWDEYGVKAGLRTENTRRLSDPARFLMARLFERRPEPVEVLELGPGAGMAIADMSRMSDDLKKLLSIDTISLSAIAPRWRLTKNWEWEVGAGVFEHLTEPYIRHQHIGPFLSDQIQPPAKYDLIHDDLGGYFYSFNDWNALDGDARKGLQKIEALLKPEGLFYFEKYAYDHWLEQLVPVEFDKGNLLVLRWFPDTGANVTATTALIIRKDSQMAQRVLAEPSIKKVDHSYFAPSFGKLLDVLMGEGGARLAIALPRAARAEDLAGGRIQAAVLSLQDRSRVRRLPRRFAMSVAVPSSKANAGERVAVIAGRYRRGTGLELFTDRDLVRPVVNIKLNDPTLPYLIVTKGLAVKAPNRSLAAQTLIFEQLMPFLHSREHRYAVHEISGYWTHDPKVDNPGLIYVRFVEVLAQMMARRDNWHVRFTYQGKSIMSPTPPSKQIGSKYQRMQMAKRILEAYHTEKFPPGAHVIGDLTQDAANRAVLSGERVASRGWSGAVIAPNKGLRNPGAVLLLQLALSTQDKITEAHPIIPWLRYLTHNDTLGADEANFLREGQLIQMKRRGWKQFCIMPLGARLAERLGRAIQAVVQTRIAA